MKTFGQRIRSIREKAQKSMRDMAKSMGVSVVYVSDIERDRRNPPLDDKLYKMAEFLELDPKEVEEWALKQRKRVELDLTEPDGAISDAAIMLARKWSTLTNDEAMEILKIFNKGQNDVK